ncbi:MAG: helix-turn-helix transcriptional regulator [Bacteroidota bacterium]
MIRLTNVNIEEFQFVSGAHEEATSVLTASGTHPDAGVGERAITFDHRFGLGRVRDCILRDIHFMELDLSLRQKTEITFATESPVLELQFNIEGSYLHPGKKIKTGVLPCNPLTHNIIFFPPQPGTFIHRMDVQKSKTLEVHLTQDYFMTLLGRNYPQAENFLMKMENGEFASMSSQSLPITASMILTIRDLLNCDKKGVLKKLFYEAKILELFMLQLEQMENMRKPGIALSRVDTERLYEVRWIIENNLQNPYSIPELARQVGINEFKLKKGFKQLFDSTIFNYLFDLRMEHARKMLLDGNYSVAAIADTAGYKHAHHFTTAFKKKYGVLPTKLKK